MHQPPDCRLRASQQHPQLTPERTGTYISYGIIGYGQPSKLAQPSGNIWGDCSAQEILDEGTGFFDYKDFKDQLPTTTAPNFGASQTYAYTANWDSVVTLTAVTGQIGNDAAIATRPLGPIVPGGGAKIWFETVIAVPTITASKGVFVGLVNSACLATTKLLNGTSTYATAANNLIGTTSGGQSGYGFWLHGDALTNFDAVWFNNIQTALTPVTIGTAGASGSGSTYTNSGIVLASVLTANANNPNPGNVNYVPPTPPGLLVNTITTATSPYNSIQQQLLAQDPNANPQVLLPNSVAGATGFVKLGLRYDGQQYLYFYVNGSQVAKLAISSVMDITSDFAGVVEVVAGASANTVLNVNFLRAAALLQP